jgi:hypothetical protein
VTDDELMAAFENASLPPGQFTHAEHVRAAWCYLTRYPLAEALARFIVALRRFAEAHGAAGKYHETMTVVYILVIADRLGDGPALTWTEFAARNADLLERSPSVLSRYYSDDVLASDRARRSFVMPNRFATGDGTPGLPPCRRRRPRPRRPTVGAR